MRLAGWSDLATVVAQGELLMGPSAGMVERGVKLLMPGASALAVLAARGDVDMAPETLEPIYLRATAFIKAPPARSMWRPVWLPCRRICRAGSTFLCNRCFRQSLAFPPFLRTTPTRPRWANIALAPAGVAATCSI